MRSPQAINNSQNYKFSAQTLSGLQDRYREIVSPLEYAKQGKVVYDIPQDDGTVSTVVKSKQDAPDFEKRYNL